MPLESVTGTLVTELKQAPHQTVNLSSFPLALKLIYCNVHYFQWNDTARVLAGWGRFHFVFYCFIRQIMQKVKTELLQAFNL